jgi:hypothetical protein
MPRSSTRNATKDAQDAQDAPLASIAPKPGAKDVPGGISKEVHDAVLARVAELEAEVAANKAQLVEAAKDVAASTAKLAGATDMMQTQMAQLHAEKGTLQADLASTLKDTRAAQLEHELASLKTTEAHKETLAAAVEEEQHRASKALGSANEKLVLADRLADAQTVKVAALERELAEERAARRTSPHSAKKQKKAPNSNWPRVSNAVPTKQDEGEDQEAYSQAAAAFLASEGGVPVKKRTRGPNKGKVDVHYEARPFQVQGCGAEDFFASLNVNGKSGLHQIVYEMGYVWDIASFKQAAYNRDESKPCQLRDVLEHIQDKAKFTFGGEECATRKVWLAAHLWPNCTAVFDKGISKLTGNEQSLLKKYVTGINQMLNAFNAFMADKGDFTPLAPSAPPPQRKLGVKRAREGEGEGEGEGEDAQSELGDDMMDSDGAVTPSGRPPIVVAETVDEAANEDDVMPEAVSDDCEVVD